MKNLQNCSLSATLSEMRDMPLDIDRIILTKPDGELPMSTGIFSKLAFSVRRVVTSFFLDYNNISGLNQNAEDSVDIWVNWGQDQAQVLNVLNQKFTEKTGIQVNLKIVNATVVQAVLSGKGPNVMLHHSRSEPVNLAIRGVLRDLKTFPDCNEVLGRFMPGAEAPYRYKDGLYALPDTQTFFMMYYRKDIFEKFKLEAPQTWDKFAGTVKTLARNNLDAWLPYTQWTALTQANTGVGSLSIFPSLVMQNGLSLYTSDNKGTTLLAGLFTILPMIYCICTAFKPLDELLIFPPKFFVRRPTLENFAVLPSLLNKLKVPMERYFINSIFVSVIGVILHIMAASAAAFVFSKSKIKGKRVLFLIVQFTLLYNAYTLTVPQYLIFSHMKIIDTYLVYILPAIPSAMGCFLMKQFIDVSIPDTLMEAARIDGAGMARIHWQIVMPIAKPAWMTLSLFSFQSMWSIPSVRLSATIKLY